jgi:hypothetical protein
VRTLQGAVQRRRSTVNRQRSRRKSQRWTGRAKRVGQWWTLYKGDHSVRCVLYWHPLGGELRCELDREAFALRPSWNLQDLFDTSVRWKEWLEKKGWVAREEPSTITRTKDLGTEPRAG